MRTLGDVDILYETGRGNAVDLLVVGVGAFAALGLEVEEKIAAHGRSVRVIDPRWVIPVSGDVVDLTREAGVVAVIEDNVVSGGIGSAVTQAIRAQGLDVPVHTHGIPKDFLDHASRGQILDRLGLTPDAIVSDLEAHLRWPPSP